MLHPVHIQSSTRLVTISSPFCGGQWIYLKPKYDIFLVFLVPKPNQNDTKAFNWMWNLNKCQVLAVSDFYYTIILAQLFHNNNIIAISIGNLKK